jgi:hypothetical protein
LLRAELGIPESSEPWTSRHEVLCGKAVSPHQRQILNICWAWRLKQEHEAADKANRRPLQDHELKKNLWADLSQGVSRRPWRLSSIATLSSSSFWYSFEFDSLLRPEHHLRAQGWPNDFVARGVSGPQLQDLAGEAYCLPCAASCLVAAHLSAGGAWWRNA